MEKYTEEFIEPSSFYETFFTNTNIDLTILETFRPMEEN